MSKESLDYQKLCSNYYSSWEEGCCMESCEFYNHNECPVVYVNGLISDLEAKLAEKDKEIKELLNYDRCSHCSYGQANKEYREKCSELIEDLAEVKNSCDYYMNRANDLLLKDQDKISFAVEQLEKVKNKFNGKRPIDDLANEVGLELGYTATQIQKYIDKQIEELKKEMK